MKAKIILLISFAVLSLQSSAINEVLKISRGSVNEYAFLADVDSVFFDEDGNTMFIAPSSGGGMVSIPLMEISEMSFIPSDQCPAEIRVSYDEGVAEVDNPFFLNGVSISLDGEYVTVTNNNTSEELTTVLSGSTGNGGFIYYGSYKTTIELNGVSITSQKGAAIDIQCGKRVALNVKKETVNTLVDCSGGTQKAALYCKGHLEIDKSGTLNVTGKTNHAISAKEYLVLKKSAGTINILGAVGDGFHCQQYFLMKGFSVNISKCQDDCIQAEAETLDTGETYEEDYPNGSLNILEGSLAITSSQNGGILNNDAYTSKGLISDGNMNLLGGTVSIKMTGTGGKCIKAEGELLIGNEDGSGPVLTATTTGSPVGSVGDGGGGGGWPGGGGGGRPGPGGGGGGGQSSVGSASKAIKAMGKATVNGGELYVSTSTDGAEGFESKTSVTINGGNNYMKCYDDCINSSGMITFAGGNTVCYSTKNDAVDSNYGRRGAITLSGGNLFAYSAAGSPEEGIDCDNNSYIVITGGIAVSAGGSQGGGGGWGGSSTSSSVGSSNQGYFLGSSPSSYKTTYFYTLCNTSGESICTYKFEGNISNSLSLLTAPGLGKGQVTVKQGTAAPTAFGSCVKNQSGTGVFFVNPTVTTTGTAATVTAK